MCWRGGGAEPMVMVNRVRAVVVSKGAGVQWW